MKFQQSGCLCTAKRTGWPGPSADTVEHAWETFVRSLQKSTHCASWELQTPQSFCAIFSYGITSRIVCMCHMIYHSCNKVLWRQSLLSAARCCNMCGRNLITGLTCAASPRVDISNTCMVGPKLGLSLPLLTCSPSVWPSWPLYCRGQISWRDLWITLYKTAILQNT